ncbi:hypothetical protein MKEN_00493900 [Mycena kentingensis (nom. inval.)]|nr:hypothetical protein MKEN_00493900 [Mycena kentingensis (nom. inval.)]
MLEADPTLVVTIFQHNLVVGQMEAELAGCEYDASRFKIHGVGSKDIAFGPTVFAVMFGELIGGWMQLLSDIKEEKHPKPRAIHFDFTCGGAVIDATKSVVGTDCKFLTWFTALAAILPAHTIEYDFAAAVEEIYADEAQRAGRSREEIQLQVAIAWNGTEKFSGKVVANPGAPDMYDYERVSVASGPPVAMFTVISSSQKLARLVDGYITTSTPAIEPVGIPQLKTLFHAREKKQELFTVGLQTSPAVFAGTKCLVTNSTVKSFLDKHGPNSVLYISFGSLFFPVETPGHVEALINTLLAAEPAFPFIFALGGAMAANGVPQPLIDRVNASGRGLICQFWVEQRAILRHEAVGWFLSHGGFNSITECTLEGVPMIIWPVGAEQPVNAAFLSAGPNPVAVELLQVRFGSQVGPSLRGGPTITGTVEDATKEFEAVFRDVRGEKGERLRANIRELGKKAREARMGEAAEEVKRLALF